MNEEKFNNIQYEIKNLINEEKITQEIHEHSLTADTFQLKKIFKYASGGIYKYLL